MLQTLERGKFIVKGFVLSFVLTFVRWGELIHFGCHLFLWWAWEVRKAENWTRSKSFNVRQKLLSQCANTTQQEVEFIFIHAAISDSCWSQHRSDAYKYYLTSTLIFRCVNVQGGIWSYSSSMLESQSEEESDIVYELGKIHHPAASQLCAFNYWHTWTKPGVYKLFGRWEGGIVCHFCSDSTFFAAFQYQKMYLRMSMEWCLRTCRSSLARNRLLLFYKVMVKVFFWTLWPFPRAASPLPPDAQKWPCVKPAGPPAAPHSESVPEPVSPSPPAPTHSPRPSADASAQLQNHIQKERQDFSVRFYLCHIKLSQLQNWLPFDLRIGKEKELTSLQFKGRNRQNVSNLMCVLHWIKQRLLGNEGYLYHKFKITCLMDVTFNRKIKICCMHFILICM